MDRLDPIRQACRDVRGEKTDSSGPTSRRRAADDDVEGRVERPKRPHEIDHRSQMVWALHLANGPIDPLDIGKETIPTRRPAKRSWVGPGAGHPDRNPRRLNR